MWSARGKRIRDPIFGYTDSTVRSWRNVWPNLSTLNPFTRCPCSGSMHRSVLWTQGNESVAYPDRRMFARVPMAPPANGSSTKPQCYRCGINFDLRLGSGT